MLSTCHKLTFYSGANIVFPNDIVQDKTGVWSPADQGLQDTITKIGPSLAEVNTKGPLNSWSDKMRVQVVFMGV